MHFNFNFRITDIEYRIPPPEKTGAWSHVPNIFDRRMPQPIGFEFDGTERGVVDIDYLTTDGDNCTGVALTAEVETGFIDSSCGLPHIDVLEVSGKTLKKALRKLVERLVEHNLSMNIDEDEMAAMEVAR